MAPLAHHRTALHRAVPGFQKGQHAVIEERAAVPGGGVLRFRQQLFRGMSYTKNNILVQSAQAMLAQANQIPQGVLQLLG